MDRESPLDFASLRLPVKEFLKVRCPWRKPVITLTDCPFASSIGHILWKPIPRNAFVEH